MIHLYTSVYKWKGAEYSLLPLVLIIILLFITIAKTIYLHPTATPFLQASPLAFFYIILGVYRSANSSTGTNNSSTKATNLFHPARYHFRKAVEFAEPVASDRRKATRTLFRSFTETNVPVRLSPKCPLGFARNSVRWLVAHSFRSFSERDGVRRKSRPFSVKRKSPSSWRHV